MENLVVEDEKTKPPIFVLIISYLYSVTALSIAMFGIIFSPILGKVLLVAVGAYLFSISVGFRKLEKSALFLSILLHAVIFLVFIFSIQTFVVALTSIVLCTYLFSIHNKFSGPLFDKRVIAGLVGVFVLIIIFVWTVFLSDCDGCSKNTPIITTEKDIEQTVEPIEGIKDLKQFNSCSIDNKDITFKYEYTVKDMVVCRWEGVLEGADPNTFEDLGGHYGKDKDSVFFAGNVINYADVETFENLGEMRSDMYARDKDNLYADGKIVKDLNSDNIRPEKFEILDNIYAKNINHVYYELKPSHSVKYSLIEEADPNTFEVFAFNNYAKDKNNIYYYGRKIDGADVGTFSIFEVFSGQGHYYSKDKNNVYFGENILRDADSDTFKAVNMLYWKDKNHVYSHANGGVLEGVDSMTFKYVGSASGSTDSMGEEVIKDDTHVYCGNEIIKWADPETFELVGSESSKLSYVTYFKDVNYVFEGCDMVKGVNPEKCTAENIEGCKTD